MGGACGPYGGRDRSVQGVGGETRGKRPLWRPRRRWEDNIRMGLQEVGLVYEDLIGLAGDTDRRRALVSGVRNPRGEFLDQLQSS